MKRFILSSQQEEKLLRVMLAAYLDARRGRDRAKARIANAQTMHGPEGWRRESERHLGEESLAVNRETIRLTTEFISILRSYR